MFVSASVAFLAIYAASVSAAPKCLAGQTTAPCVKNQDWYDNLRCRILGPGEEGARKDGYMDLIKPSSADSTYVANMKLRANISYNQIATQMTTNYKQAVDASQRAMLVQWENEVTRLGHQLFGVNWVSPASKCAVGSGTKADCGDLDNYMKSQAPKCT